MGLSRQIGRIVRFLVVIATGCQLHAQKPMAARPKDPNTPVLVLVSRNVSDPWAAAEVDGMRRALAAATPPITPIVEYLDWQTGSGADYEEKLASYYAGKFAKRDIRVIIAAENAAVDFLLKRRDALFPKAQAVFCGITRFDEKKRQPWCTGVLETSDPDGTFALARRLQPDLDRFIILDDSSGAGATAKRMIETAHPDASQQVQFELRKADTVQDTYTAVEDLPPHSAVLITKSRLVFKVMEDLRDHCPVPIYGTRSPTQLPGILGGSLLDGERQGQIAAQFALRLLAGERPADIPFESKVPHRLVVDYGQMQRFGIPLSALPPGCEVLNRPLTLWEKHRRVLLASGAIILVLGGLVIGLFWQLRQKRAAVLKLDRSLSLLSATFDSISDGVLVVDNARKISGCNKRFLTLWRIQPEFAAGKDDAQLLQSVLGQLKDPEAFRKGVQELYDHPEAVNSELIEFADGRVFERDSRPQVQGGEIVGRVWSFRDVTSRRRAEEERERLSAQLAQGQKMEALGTLAGGVAHDFNNILTGILGCSDLALNHLPESHPAVAALRQVVVSAERASDLVRQILTFSRKRTPEKKVIALEPIVSETLQLLRATAPAAIELAAELPPGVPPVFADPAQMHQALLNLCTNAIQAMGRGPGNLRVGLAVKNPPEVFRKDHPQWLPGPLVCLTVTDTGHGMTPAELARVFEPFFTTKEPGVGTGLGLAVVHGIAEIHDGAVTVRSEVDQGTTFEIFLPPAQEPIAASPELKPAPSGHGERILVVDDEQLVANIVAGMLRRLGYEVTTCAGAEQALERLAAEPDGWALLLSDLNMPRMTGLDLIRHLRANGNAVPCLLASGFVDSARTEAEASALGIGAILDKPFTKDSLGRAVAAELAAHQPAAVAG
jgi:signal transduction histidine kinase/ActR/RegA family two-component response regulator/ABC-type uncharacterized transport system substrate-binding protein